MSARGVDLDLISQSRPFLSTIRLFCLSAAATNIVKSMLLSERPAKATVAGYRFSTATSALLQAAITSFDRASLLGRSATTEHRGPPTILSARQAPRLLDVESRLGNFLSNTVSRGRSDGFQTRRTCLSREMETPAPEDSAGFATCVLLEFGHRQLARHVGTGFAMLACVRSPGTLRKITTSSRTIRVVPSS